MTGLFLTDCFDTESIEGVIHFAANSQVGESMTKPLKYYNNNLYGTMTLLEALLAQAGVFKCNPDGTEAFLRFANHVGAVQ